MPEKQFYVLSEQTAAGVQKLLRPAHSTLPKSDRFREWPPQAQKIIPVDATAISGQATASPANWRYDLKRAFTDEVLLADVDPVALPHRYQRPPFGTMKAAKAGWVVVNPDANQPGEPPYIVWDLNEVPQPSTCAAP